MVINLTVKPMDFITIEYEAHDEHGRVFDATSGEVARTLHGKEGPLTLIFGFDRLPIGLEEAITKMEKGEEKQVHLQPDQAFGRPRKSLVKVFPFSYFEAHDMKPEVGMTIYLDTNNGRLFGTVKSISSGRVVVDLNHPLAGQPVTYKIKITDVLKTTEDKIKSLLTRHGLEGKISLDGDTLAINLQKKERANNPQYELNKMQMQVLVKKLFGEIKHVNINESVKEPAKETAKT